MTERHRRLLVCFTALMLQLNLQAQSTTTPAPTSTGQKIVSAIAGIATAIVPALAPIKALFGPTDPGTKKTTKDAVNTATTIGQKAAVASQTTQISKLTEASTDLATISTVLHYCIYADENLTQVDAILASQKTPDSTSKANIEKAWGAAKTNLNSLVTDSLKTKVAALTDTFAQTTLGAVIDANQSSVTNFSNIDSDVKAGNWDGVRNSIATLRPKVAGVNLLAAILISDIGNSLSEVKGQIAPAAGSRRLSREDAERLKRDIDTLKATYPAGHWKG